MFSPYCQQDDLGWRWLDGRKVKIHFTEKEKKVFRSTGLAFFKSFVNPGRITLLHFQGMNLNIPQAWDVHAQGGPDCTARHRCWRSKEGRVMYNGHLHLPFPMWTHVPSATPWRTDVPWALKCWLLTGAFLLWVFEFFSSCYLLLRGERAG